jgi:hypothetical protein
MKISDRFLSRSIVILVITTLISAYACINGSVSYKYEVEATNASALNAYQKGIIRDIFISEVVFVISLVFLILIIVAFAIKPSFNGRLKYVNKGVVA